LEDNNTNKDLNYKIVNKDLTILDYLSVFTVNRKKILLVVSIVAIVTGILYFFVFDPVYLSTGVIKTTSKGSSLSGLLGSSGLPDLGEFGDLASGGGASAQELALYENILISRKCLEETIYKFGIMEKENIKNMFDALKFFRENVMEVSKDKASGTLSIGIYDTDPAKAKEIADFLIYQLNKINVELNVQDARNNRVFIQERYDLANIELRKVEDSLQMFQDMFGVAPEIQVQAAIKGQIELEAEIKSEEVKLELLKKILTPDQPEMKAQEQKIIELSKQLHDINNTDYQKSKLSLKNSPEVVMNYLRLKRNVEIQNKILTTLIPILEQSKISENRETPTVLVLDPPQIPDRKSKPKRLTSMLIFSTLAFVLSYSYFFLKLYIASKKRI
jgi:capsule polysaccharide export protein KpsE/RkpR